jgi:polyisoprenoid-binding protein YceI
MATITQQHPHSTATIPAGTWRVDPVHSSVEFHVRNLGIVNVKGFFSEFEGVLESGGDLDSVRVYGTSQAASINTRSAKRDAHLRAPEFFDVDNHPELRFESTGVERAGDQLRVVGDLTIKGITREVQFDAVIDGSVPDPWGGERVGVQATAKIDRRDFGLKWDVAGPTGELLVANEVKIEIDIGAVKDGG